MVCDAREQGGVTGILGGALDASLRRARQTLRPSLRPRRTNVCCCGLSKTGTHSLAGIFEGYRSAHHPDGELRLGLASAFLRGELDAAPARRTLRRRDRALWLEMESSSLAGILIEPLARACPDKKFVLTVRDPLGWCDSWLDHNLNLPPEPGSPWAALDRLRLRVADFPATRFDAPLTERGFPPLACFFQLWASHNQRVLEALPAERLLVLRTGEIAGRLPELAAWAGVPVETLRADRSRLFVAPKKHGMLGLLDPSYVHELAERSCGPLSAALRVPAA